MLKVVAMVGALLMLPGCAVFEAAGLGGDATGIFGEIAEKGRDVETKVFQEFASGFDKYCDKTPTILRDWARNNVNTNTASYNLPDICVPKPVPTAE